MPGIYKGWAVEGAGFSNSGTAPRGMTCLGLVWCNVVVSSALRIAVFIIVILIVVILLLYSNIVILLFFPLSLCVLHVNSSVLGLSVRFGSGRRGLLVCVWWGFVSGC